MLCVCCSVVALLYSLLYCNIHNKSKQVESEHKIKLNLDLRYWTNLGRIRDGYDPKMERSYHQVLNTWVLVSRRLKPRFQSLVLGLGRENFWVLVLVLILKKLSATVSSANWKIGDQTYYRQFGELSWKNQKLLKAVLRSEVRLMLLGSTRRTYCIAIAFTATSSEVEILIGSLIWN